MGKSDYQEIMDKIKASDKFKVDTVKKMQEELNKDSLKVIEMKKMNKIKRFIPIVACFAVVLILLAWQGQKDSTSDNKGNKVNNNGGEDGAVVNNGSSNKVALESLPKLIISDEVEGMGFEGYMAYSIDDLENGNPWVEDNNLTTLPVYKNKSYLENIYPTANLTAEEMINKAKDIAEVINIEINELYTTPTQEELQAYEKKSGRKQDEIPRESIAKGDGVEIRVETSGDIRIFFEPAIEVPEEYRFTHYNISKEEVEKVLDYLTKQYEYLIDMKSPAQDVFGDYTFNGERGFNYTIYESCGNLSDKILGYAFNRVSFSPNDNGKLWIIDINKTDLSEKVGEYPIINTDEAKEMLLAGQYISTAPKEVSEDKIAKVELVYRNSAYDKTFIPYYKFYVELSSMEQDNGLKTFGAFYVPAIKSEYIENMPIW